MNDHSSSTRSWSSSGGSTRARSTVSGHSRSITAQPVRNPSASVGRIFRRSGSRRSSSASMRGATSTPFMRTSSKSPVMSTPDM
jgi:hypothetical protein